MYPLAMHRSAVVLAGLLFSLRPIHAAFEPQLNSPVPGTLTARLLSDHLVEIERIGTQLPGAANVDAWAWVDTNRDLHLPAITSVQVEVSGRPVTVQKTGFRRRPLSATLREWDLRLGSSLYLELAEPVQPGDLLRLSTADPDVWDPATVLEVEADPLRWSPAIHVNQSGYLPGYSKKAWVGLNLGSLGELTVAPALPFTVVRMEDGKVLWTGQLKARPDSGFSLTPTPYQAVWEADFTGLDTPGGYRLAVPGLGASYPFRIDPGVAAGWARNLALGLYHQRCGTNNVLPFTRFAHDVCHVRRAEVPTPAFTVVQSILAQMNADATNNVRHTAPVIGGVEDSLYPFVNTGSVDISGGHHDAGDYSKYTVNSASLIHHLVFAVDAFPGVSVLDNLGLPESGDGIPDVLQEAKWEADFLAKMQDGDGGFYALVYPRDRKYESDVLPDAGDPQVVYPKNTAATAGAVAALAEAGSSPAMRLWYPAAAEAYRTAAQRGWSFLEAAFAAHGRDGAYQKVGHFGDANMHDDEIVWAEAALFAATGDPALARLLYAEFDPASRNARRWTWWRLWGPYGCAIRTYAFAARTGRRDSAELDAAYLATCETQLLVGAEDQRYSSDHSAYGTSYPYNSKRLATAGWYFSNNQAFDLAVGCTLDDRPEWMTALLANLNYERGANPINQSYVTGLGWQRQRNIVSQSAANARRQMPPDGVLIGN